MEEYTVREFIRLTPPQKERLWKRDPEQYMRLKQESERQFPKESDDLAARELMEKR